MVKLEVLAKDLVDLWKCDISTPENPFGSLKETPLGDFVTRLRNRDLVSLRLVTPMGAYVIRDDTTGGPILLVNGREIVFLDLEFAKLVLTALIEGDQHHTEKGVYQKIA